MTIKNDITKIKNAAEQYRDLGMVSYLTCDTIIAWKDKDGKEHKADHSKSPSLYKWSGPEISLEEQIERLERHPQEINVNGVCILTGFNSRLVSLDWDPNYNFREKEGELNDLAMQALGMSLYEAAYIEQREDKQSFHNIFRIKHSDAVTAEMYRFKDLVGLDGKKCLEVKGEGKIITVAPHISKGKSLSPLVGSLTNLPEITMSQFTLFYNLMKDRWDKSDIVKAKREIKRQEKRDELRKNNPVIASVHPDDKKIEEFIKAYNEDHDIAGVLESYGYQISGDAGNHPDSSVDTPDVHINVADNTATLWGGSDILLAEVLDIWLPNNCENLSKTVSPYMVTLVKEYSGDREAMYALEGPKYGFEYSKPLTDEEKGDRHKGIMAIGGDIEEDLFDAQKELEDLDLDDLIGESPITIEEVPEPQQTLSEVVPETETVGEAIKTLGNSDIEKLWNTCPFEICYIAAYLKANAAGHSDGTYLLFAIVVVAVLSSKRVKVSNRHIYDDFFYSNLLSMFIAISGENKSRLISLVQKLILLDDLSTAPVPRFRNFGNKIGSGPKAIQDILCGAPVERRLNIKKGTEYEEKQLQIRTYVNAMKKNHLSQPAGAFVLDEAGSKIEKHLYINEEFFNDLYDGDIDGTKNLGDTYADRPSTYYYGHAVSFICATQPQGMAKMLKEKETSMSGVLGRWLFITNNAYRDIEFIDTSKYDLSKEKFLGIGNMILDRPHWSNEIVYEDLLLDGQALETYKTISTRIKKEKVFINASRMASPCMLLGKSKEETQAMAQAIVPVIIENASKAMSLCLNSSVEYDLNDLEYKIDTEVKRRFLKGEKNISVYQITNSIVSRKYAGASKEISDALKDMDFSQYGYKYIMYKSKDKEDQIRCLVKVD